MMAKRRRRRDYKAEYQRRLARGAAKGKTRQAARGHKVAEHVERKHRAIAKYGATPYELTKWRKLAFDQAYRVLVAPAKNPVTETVLKKGIRLLHIDDLKALAEMDPFAIVSAVKIQVADLAGLEQYFPHSIDTIEEEAWNPLWYHP